MLLTLPVCADPIFEYTSRSDAGWRISARPTAAERPVTVCEKTLNDVLAGERIHIEGWAQVDAMNSCIGVNVQLAYCDPECNYSGRRWPGVHTWAAGNVCRGPRGEHHKTMAPRADYISASHQQSVTFRLFVNVYASNPAGESAGVDDCAITFERYRE